MADVRNTQFVTLRSTDRVSGTGGQATFRLPSLDLPKSHTVFLVNATIPYTFYNIEAPDNLFSFRETGAITATASFSITPGNYTSQELATLLEAEMTTNSPNSETYTVDYNFNTGKFTFDTGDPATVLDFDEIAMSLKLFLAIGFYNEVTGGFTKDGATTGQIITSPNYAQAGPSHLVLESNLRHRGHHTQFRALNQMATFPLSGGPGDIMVYEPQDRIELVSLNDLGALSNIRITIRRDDTGQPITSFNGAPWVITLGIRGFTEN